MFNSQLFSRRDTDAKVDFRPNMPTDPQSPYAQVRRLKAHLNSPVPTADDITDCPDALDALREYTYRKIFTGVSHDEYMRTPEDVIDWLIIAHEIESERFRNAKKRD